MITMDEIAGGAELGSLTGDDLAALLCRLAAVQTRLAAYLSDAPIRTGGDRLLDATEAAAKLGVDPQWLYRRSKDLPFVVRLDGHVRFSLAGIEKFIATRCGR